MKRKSSGVITRSRTTNAGVEKSTIDFVIVSDDLVEDIKTVVIDEDKLNCLSSIRKTKKAVVVTKSDHNSIITNFTVKWDKNLKKHKKEGFNLKNLDGQKKFKELTSKKGTFTTIFSDKINDIESIMKKFLKKIEGCLHQSFSKVRVKNKENTELDNLYNQRRILRTKTDNDSKKKLEKIEEELADKFAEENYKIIKEEIKDMECDEGGINAGKLWKLKKKLSPRTQDVPTAMLDQHGNLVTSETGIKKIAIDHYTKVLKNREIKDGLKHVQNDKEELFTHRLDLAKASKSAPWTMDQLEAVLKYIKNNKSRDPNDHANELFKPNVAGSDLKLALLYLMNRIKDTGEFPEALRTCNITSIFKKGARNSFDNYRGIFRVTIIRSIIDRLVYNDIYPVVDSNLTDSNVGSRKGRNVRDNLFVLHATINSIKAGKEEACDLAIYDVEKCFDSLWSQECLNDLWDVGCQDDKLNILAQGNKSALVAIKTSKGITERISITNTIMQGTVNSGLLCTSTTDKLAKMVYSDSSLTYKYKGVADVPPLEMVDDILTISKCSITSVAMNATVNAFLENKKLKLSQGKCCVIHVGKVKEKCHELKAHGEKIHQVESAKYLGDIIHKNGKVTTNLAEQRVKAAASSSIIRAILQYIPLGKHQTEIGLELRQAMFINSVLYNSETWHGLKPTDITELELIDKQLLRFICKAHAKHQLNFYI